MARLHLSVIIPAYNEAERLPLTLADVDAYLQKENFSYEVIVVDDGSRDATAEIARKMSSSIRNLRVISNEKNLGKGAAVRQGMLAAKGKIRLFMDADNSTSISQFQAMRPYFRKGYSVVVGSRAIKGSKLDPPEPWYKQILGKAGNLIIQALLLRGIWDTQCGFKALTDKAAEAVFRAAKINGWGFDAEALALADKIGFRIKEIPVRWENSPFSHVRFSAYLKVLWETVKIRWWLWFGGYGIAARKNK
jgi:dolichyl-phosphate beta-glucosyltransferase